MQEELYRRYSPRMYAVCLRYAGNSEEAEDILQEGFIKALTHLQSFQGRSSFKTWLLRVVSNAALDMGRQRGRRQGCSESGRRAEGRAARDADANDEATPATSDHPRMVSAFRSPSLWAARSS